MPVEYKMHFYDESGIRQAEINDFLAAEYMRQRNDVGYLRFELPFGHRLIDQLDVDWQVKVQFKDDQYGIPWTTDFEGLFQSSVKAVNSRGTRTFTGWCVTSLDFLNRSIVAYRADTANRNAFTNVVPETIAKTIVQYNATASGTTGDGRLRNVDGWGSYITIETDGATGVATDYRCAWDTTLGAVQGIAQIANADFDLVKTGALTWQFRWYPNGLGSDVSADVIFGLNRHNMEQPELTVNLHPASVAIVAGEGEEADRNVAIQSHTNYETNHGAREIYVDARSHKTADGLAAIGADRLEQAQRTRSRLLFQMLQVPSTLYRVHYNLGSYVGSLFGGVSTIKRIDKATVYLSPLDEGGSRVENIDFWLTDVEG